MKKKLRGWGRRYDKFLNSMFKNKIFVFDIETERDVM